MKLKHFLNLIALSAIMSSCETILNIDVFTEVYPDGSCRKVFQNRVPLSFMLGEKFENGQNYFPQTIDTTQWDVSWKYKDGNINTKYPIQQSDIEHFKIDTASLDNDFELTISKHFDSVDEMNSFLSTNKYCGTQASYTLKKQFRWFFTYYTYTELYPKLNFKTNLLPISNYLDEHEAEYWFNGNTQLLTGMNGIEINEFCQELERKYNRWIRHLLWNEEYRIYVDNYDRLQLNISKSEFISLSDTIFNQQGDMLILDMSHVLDKYFDTKQFSEFINQNVPLFDYDETNGDFFELFLNPQSVVHNNTLKLPGKVLSGNYYQLDNNGLMSWRVTPARVFLKDYTVYAKSRKANWWAFTVSLLIVFAAMYSVFFIKKDKY